MSYYKANTATHFHQIKNRINYLTHMISYIKLCNKWMSLLTTISQPSTMKTAENISRCSRKKDGLVVWRNLAYKTYIRMEKFSRAWKRFWRTFWRLIHISAGLPQNAYLILCLTTFASRVLKKILNTDSCWTSIKMTLLITIPAPAKSSHWGTSNKNY